MSETDTQSFEHSAGFTAGEVAGSFGLGPLELQYEELFGEALADGVITAEERAQLDRAADNLGLDRQRLYKLETAMVAAYQRHHRVEVIEHDEPAQSLSPIRIEAAGDPAKVLLLKRIENLEARIAELEEELKHAQANVNVEVDLSDIGAADDSEDPDECWRRVRRDPTNADSVRALYRAYQGRANVDAQWCTAGLLDLLGAANADQKAVLEKHRSPTLMVPKAGVSASAWHDFLFHPEEEVGTGQIFGVIAPAVLLGRVTTLRRDGQLHRADPATLQDPAVATVTAVRALNWAAAILGLAAPRMYLEKSNEGGFVHTAAVPPYTVVGKGVLSGKTQLEHAFLAGRHLTFYRQEHFVRTLYSAVEDLEDLFLAALTLGNRGLPMTEDVKRRVAPIAGAIEPLLQPPQVDMLRGFFLRFVEEGGRTNLQRWSAAVDKTACRAGLLLCNDLATAVKLLEAEEGERGDLTRDVLAFAVSDRYMKLRRQLGVAIA